MGNDLEKIDLAQLPYNHPLCSGILDAESKPISDMSEFPHSILYMPPKSQTIWDYGILNAQIKFGTALLKNSQIPNVDQFSSPTNKCSEFVRVTRSYHIFLMTYD